MGRLTAAAHNGSDWSAGLTQPVHRPGQRISRAASRRLREPSAAVLPRSYVVPVVQFVDDSDHGRIDGINEPTTVVDFSGWPIVVHKSFPDELAYHIAGVLEKIREQIPYDAAEAPSMKQLCSNTEAGPLDFPLHSGAER